MKHNIIKYLILGVWLFLDIKYFKINYNRLHFRLKYQIKFNENQNIN